MMTNHTKLRAECHERWALFSEFDKMPAMFMARSQSRTYHLRVSPALLMIIILLQACNTATLHPSEIPGSGPTRGAELVDLNPLGDAPGCMTCHGLEANENLVGPPLSGIATLAQSQTTGLSAENYLEQSLIDPDLHLASDYNPGAMPRYGNVLSDQDIDDIVAYLLTLE